ncbi:hypothetical protein FJT64_024733 [Amphibalanus amphitrite]|uniref:IGFBP N-terminal domain-containing protein n=1 Tax=Amphibalanus amphitrite TaxID=1232801 RepID=A0A6A4WI38_AMPAM|nr:hypothetical protein FJT64_024733 [Amphibalanus amphitrite]
MGVSMRCCLLAVTVLAVLLASAAAMPACNCTYRSCEPELREFHCPYGEGRDPCDCCRVCLKGPADKCGPLETPCGHGLYCDPVKGQCRSVHQA